MTTTLVFLAATLTLSSFHRTPSVDTFAIYLDEQLILHAAVWPQSSLQTIALPPGNVTLKVDYSHCGKTGSDRKLSARDAANRTLKSWEYDEGVPMTVNTKELTALHKEQRGMRLVYSSREIPDGKVLVAVQEPTAAR